MLNKKKEDLFVNTSRAERKMRKQLKKQKWELIALQITVLLCGAYLWYGNWNMFWDLLDDYKDGVTRYHLVIENRSREVGKDSSETTHEAAAPPVASSSDEGASTPSASEEDHIAQIVSGIYMLESSAGKNNFSKCEEQGKFNGYGYGIPGNGDFICFDSHEEATKTVYSWVKKKKEQGYSTQELLCIYNTGQKDSCRYFEDFQSVIS